LRGEPEHLPSQEIAHAIAGTMEQLKAVRTFIKAEFQIGYKDASGKIVTGTDAGLIPGCGDKPTLFLPGAQKATMYFNCFPTYKVQERDLGNGHVSIRVRCLLISRATRDQVGEGVGCCSTMEKKYRWRGNEKLCPACGKPTIRKSKDKPEFYCWKKIDGCGATFGLKHPEIVSQGDGSPVENTDLYDLHNTVLKMAKKRAHVDAAMTLACLSEMFTQDIEDTFAPNEVREAARPYDGEVYEAPEPEPAKPTPPPVPSAKGLFSNEQVKRTRDFAKWLGDQCREINRKWHKGDDDGRWEGWEKKLAAAMEAGQAVPAKVPDVVTFWQARGHLFKWAVREKHLTFDSSVDLEEAKTRQIDAYVALVHHEHKKELIAEMGAYLQDERTKACDAIYRRNPDIAPVGWVDPREGQAEAEDKGDAYDGPEPLEEALSN
jgi:hypothetical protein